MATRGEEQVERTESEVRGKGKGWGDDIPGWSFMNQYSNTCPTNHTPFGVSKGWTKVIGLHKIIVKLIMEDNAKECGNMQKHVALGKYLSLPESP